MKQRMKNNSNKEILKKIVREFLDNSNIEISSDLLNETPNRVVKAWLEMTSGYAVDDTLLYKTFSSSSKGLIVVKNIEFSSICEHHLLPFSGVVHIGYIPNDGVLGLSKFARIVDCFSKRLQIQEKMIIEIGESIIKNLKPKDLFIIVSAKHSCMSCRGVEQSSSETISFFTYGKFKDYKEHELIAIIK